MTPEGDGGWVSYTELVARLNGGEPAVDGSRWADAIDALVSVGSIQTMVIGDTRMFRFKQARPALRPAA